MSRSEDFPKNRFLAKAHALALGGRIDTIELDGKKVPVGAGFAIDGGSCSLGSEGGRSISRAKSRSTVVGGQRIVHFDAAEAEAWEEYRTEGPLSCRTFTRAAIRGLEVGGAGDMPLLRLEYGEVVVRADHVQKDDIVEVTFKIEVERAVNLVLGGERINLEDGKLGQRPPRTRRWIVPASARRRWRPRRRS